MLTIIILIIEGSQLLFGLVLYLFLNPPNKPIPKIIKKMLTTKSSVLYLVKNPLTEIANATGNKKETKDKQAGHAGTKTAKTVPIPPLPTLPLFCPILQVLS